MAKQQTREEMAKFLETPLGEIDRAFSDLQLASHWLLYAAGQVNTKKECRQHLREAARFAERGLKQIRNLMR